jgi:hypothetical protein
MAWTTPRTWVDGETVSQTEMNTHVRDNLGYLYDEKVAEINGYIVGPIEKCTVSATAATGTINFDAITQSVLYYTTDAAANWTLNVRGSSGTTLNALLATGQSITITFLVTQGASAYYQSALQVDGGSVTPKWQGGTAPTAGNASSVDAYTITIVKTGNAAFTAFAAQTKFA